MSNGSTDDLHRSARRYIAEALGESWTIRTEREVVNDDQRPAVVVEFSTPIGRFSGARPDRRTIPQGDVSRMGTIAVQAYPTIFATAREGKEEAERIVQLLDDSVTFGLVDNSGPEPVDIGHPLAVPIYNYAGVPTTGPNRAGPAEPYMWAMVEDHSVQPIQDPIDENRWTVAMSMRLSWWRAGRRVADAPAVTRLIPEPEVQ